jgi:Protein of unknown function (DUF1579)
MNIRKVWMGVAGVTVMSMLAGFTAQPAGDKPKTPAPGQPAQPGKKDAAIPGQPSEADMMAAMKKAAEPGEQHKVLKAFEGRWNGKMTCTNCFTGETETSDGTMNTSWILGNRYLRQEWKGTFAGEPFEGVGYFGYDNTKKHYFSTWFDTMSTGVMVSTGKYDPATKKFTLSGTFPDPMSGKDTTVRQLVTIVDDNTHKMEMWGPGPDGKDAKMMEIVYTRPGKGAEPAKPTGSGR